MKRFLLVALFSSVGFVYGQIWTYDMSPEGTLGTSVSGDGLMHVSSASTATFLASPPSGSVLVASTAGTPTFERVGSGASAGLKITSPSVGAGSAKFTGFAIPEATAVSAISFTLTLHDNPNLTRSDWYFAVGKNGSMFNGTGGLSISNTGASTNSQIFGCFRLILNESTYPTTADAYRFQSRAHAVLTESVAWEKTNESLFTRGGTFNIELYCNNTSSNITYSISGTTYTVASRTYHIWVNGVRLGSSYPANAIPLNDKLNSFMLMSRDINESANTSQATISNVSLRYSSTSTLPVSFNSFTGKRQENNIYLNWATISEQNNSHFEILRSSDGQAFDVIGKVNGNGNSNEIKAYSFIDSQPIAGTNYYKLRQVDFDGKSNTFKEVVAIETDLLESKFNLFATSDNQVKASVFSEKATSARIQISDVSGRKIYDEKINLVKGLNQSVLAAPVNTPGVYVGVLSMPEQTISLKFLK